MDEKKWEIGKKALCCAGLIKDLLVVLFSANHKKLASAMDSKECEDFIKSADAFSEKLK